MNRIKINPNLAVRSFVVGGEEVNFQVGGGKKGDWIRFSEFSRKKNNEFYPILKKVLFERSFSNLSFEKIEQLKKWNILVESDEVSEPVRFSVRSVSSQARGYSRVNRSVFPFHSSLKKLSKGFSLEEILEHPPEKYFWIQDPQTEICWPAVLSGIEKKAYADLVEGRKYPHDLSSELRGRLESLLLLIPEKEKKGEKDIFQKKSAAFLSDLFPGAYRVAMAKYYNQCRNQGWCRYGDKQTVHRYWNHNDGWARFIHEQLRRTLKKRLDVDLKPTFCTYLDYSDGGDLTKHLDREQAAYTLSVLVDFEVNGKPSEDQWPIFVEKQPKTDRYDRYLVGLGNGVIFNGERLIHYRSPISSGHYSRSLCFHFAQNHFNGKVL